MKFLIVLLSIILSSAAFTQTSDRYITVTGNSEIVKKADQLKFNVQIKSIDKTVEVSRVANDKHLVNLMIILKGMDISSEDIEISPISFGRNYEHTEKGLTSDGYFTNINVSFLLQDITQYYDLTNRLSSNDAFEISAEYVISDYEEQHRTAYEKAVDAAYKKAVYLSAVLNMQVGEVIEIEENNIPEHFAALNTISRETTEENVSGKVSLKRSVRVKFAINPKR